MCQLASAHAFAWLCLRPKCQPSARLDSESGGGSLRAFGHVKVLLHALIDWRLVDWARVEGRVGDGLLPHRTALDLERDGAEAFEHGLVLSRELDVLGELERRENEGLDVRLYRGGVSMVC